MAVCCLVLAVCSSLIQTESWFLCSFNMFLIRRSLKLLAITPAFSKVFQHAIEPRFQLEQIDSKSFIIDPINTHMVPVCVCRPHINRPQLILTYGHEILQKKAVLWLFQREGTWEHYEYPWDVSLCSSHKKTQTILAKLSAHGSHNCKRHAPLAHGHLQGTKTNQKLHLNTWFLRVTF